MFHTQKGFSLVELMISAGILGIIAVIIMNTTDLLGSRNQAIERKLSLDLEVKRALNTILNEYVNNNREISSIDTTNTSFTLGNVTLKNNCTTLPDAFQKYPPLSIISLFNTGATQDLLDHCPKPCGTAQRSTIQIIENNVVKASFPTQHDRQVHSMFVCTKPLEDYYLPSGFSTTRKPYILHVLGVTYDNYRYIWYVDGAYLSR